MNPFNQYETAGWLSHRNPTAKLCAHLALTLMLTVVFDPLTPLLFLAVALVTGATLARAPLVLQFRSLAPFALLGVSLAVSNALFANAPERATVLWQWGPFTATVEGALIGVSLAARAIAIAAFALLIVFTTDPTLFIRSLVQHARLPARFAYPVLAAYRFLPMLQAEFETIRLAQNLRGRELGGGPLGWFRRQRRLVIPLLTGAIRRADRVAIAMDSRGFNSPTPRTHYRRVPFTRTDTALIVGAILTGASIIAFTWWLGVLRLWTGAYVV